MKYCHYNEHNSKHRISYYDMLDLNLPKHCFAFLRKKAEDGYNVCVTYASDILKRNTDSIRCAVENDVFSSLPDESLLDELEMRCDDEE